MSQNALSSNIYPSLSIEACVTASIFSNLVKSKELNAQISVEKEFPNDESECQLLSDYQLREYYKNESLETLDVFIDQFVKVSFKFITSPEQT